DDLGFTGTQLRHAAIAVTVVAALLMVSRIRYNSFKGSGHGPKADRVPFFAIVVALAMLIALVIDPPKVLLAAATLYALSGPLLWLRRRRAASPAGTE
ncbi:MAG: CDP-diacylglycerol--serine O-phosphatidyltransferase, partial [Luteimonas sp.]